MTAGRRSLLTSTYRLQFNKGFTFRQAEQLIPYLADLGVSHIYASPYLKARAGSSHGYDITDYNALNPEVGDEADLDAMVAALHRHDMGQVLDFVPNHMGVGKADSLWWLDVLEWGQASPYAAYFDIDWMPAKEDLHGKVLLPFLGDHYGQVLENGELQVVFDAEAGSFSVHYHEHAFPIRPAHYGEITTPYVTLLQAEGDPRTAALKTLTDMAQTCLTLRISGLPQERRRQVREAGLAFKRDLAAQVAAQPDLRSIIDEAVRHINGSPGDADSFLLLHRLLERQSYRLAFWRVAADEINYRRFFDVNDLAGVRMENPTLFDVAHGLVLRLARKGVIDGLRIDHIDGMFDPAQYCRRLATRFIEIARYESSESDSEAADDEALRRRFYVVVEKILARHESLRRDWPIDGTTGYEVLNLINGLFVRPDAEASLSEIYSRFIGQHLDFDRILYDCKRLVMDQILTSELQVLANTIDKISESNWRTRDFTLRSLRTVLEEVAANFPVYRTYVDDKTIAAEDRRDIDWAVGQARKISGHREDTIFNFIHSALTSDAVRKRGSGYSRRAIIQFAMKFQQYTGPVMAKSLEDTSFYRFNRLLSLNEVGGDPRRFGLTPSAFHHLMQERMRHWPRAMVTTATHDTKRGEDARARLNVLSELAEDWDTHIAHWATFNRRFKIEQDGDQAPSTNDEYCLYQVMLGSWPNELMEASSWEGDGLRAYCERVEATAIKSARESKSRTSWASPDQAYEDAIHSFVQGILDPARSPQFLADFTDFSRRVAWFGMLNSLSQTVLKLTLPGIPDTYQGADLWDYAMVDPDNRRPVDFAGRAALLRDLPDEVDPQSLLASWPDGRIKLLILSRLLRLRRRKPDLFLTGAYHPLAAEGNRGDHLCAFARLTQSDGLVVIAPRFFVALSDGRTELPQSAAWADTMTIGPGELAGRRMTNLLTGETISPEAGPDGAPQWMAAALLGSFPIGIWLAEEATGAAGAAPA